MHENVAMGHLLTHPLNDPLGCLALAEVCRREFGVPSLIANVERAGLKGHLVRDSQLEAAGALPLLADARLPFPACRSAGCAAPIMSRSQSSFSCVASG
jgi:hypothetical protein